jgi:hypothetical protein
MSVLYDEVTLLHCKNGLSWKGGGQFSSIFLLYLGSGLIKRVVFEEEWFCKRKTIAAVNLSIIKSQLLGTAQYMLDIIYILNLLNNLGFKG